MRRLVLLLVVIAAMFSALHRWAPAPFSSAEVLAARARWQAGDGEAARELARAAANALEQEVKHHPSDGYRHAALGEALTLAGDPERGLREALHATAVQPVPWARHPRALESVMETYAVVAAEAGAVAEAVRVIERLTEFREDLTAEALEADPRFASLHGNPRFAALVERRAAAGSGDARVRSLAARRRP